MKTILFKLFLPVLILLCLFTSCEPDPIEDIEEPYLFDQTLLNESWLSEGYDLASIFQGSLQSLRLDISDSIYTLTQLDPSGSSITYAGTIEIIDPSDSTQQIFPITFYQHTPDTLVSKGIAQLNNEITTKEILIDIVPVDSSDYLIPQIEEGFGSGHFGLGGIQRYRQN